ncbi:MAG: hypothetical protein ACO26H_02195 [Sediminibacterium sp.]
MPKSKVILKKPNVREKDLTKDKVWGWANQEDFEVEIEKNQPAKEYLNTLVHEMLHCLLPDLNESQISRMANIMADEIWRKRFRRLSK